MQNRRDILILAGLFLALVLFVIFGPARQAQQEDPNRPTSYASGEGGALGLYTWLNRLGYDARRLEYRPFALDDGDAMLVILNPSERINRDQADETLRWVENGGTLLLADDSSALFGNSRALLDELNLDVRVISTTATIERAPVSQPVFTQPPTRDAQVRTGRVLEPRGEEYAKLVGPEDSLIMAGIRRGRGYIYVSSATHPFTNLGLRDDANAALVLNLLRRVPPGGRVLFDEIHHGYVTPPSATRALLGTPWGWAASYAVVVTALFLMLSGRRFGRPVPLAEEIERRTSAEYVESMADLFQRGGKRAFIARHFHASLKRRLARPYGVNPRLEDEEFVRELARARDLDEAALLAALRRLQAAPAGESELVRAVSDAEALAEQLLARPGR